MTPPSLGAQPGSDGHAYPCRRRRLPRYCSCGVRIERWSALSRSDIDCPQGSCVFGQTVCLGGANDGGIAVRGPTLPRRHLHPHRTGLQRWRSKGIRMRGGIRDCPNGTSFPTGLVCYGGDLDRLSCVGTMPTAWLNLQVGPRGFAAHRLRPFPTCRCAPAGVPTVRSAMSTAIAPMAPASSHRTSVTVARSIPTARSVPRTRIAIRESSPTPKICRW